MTYAEAIEFLYGLRLSGTKLGLEQPRALARLADRPQDRLRFIHVAGTNGKGSVCAMLERIYRMAGYRVGLFTSPHLTRFGERIQVDRVPISKEALVGRVVRMLPRLAEFEGERPTFFEVVTVIALEHFAESECDVVIWETGLGGRLDATNIVSPLASVITNVQFDHEKWLGDSLGAIAREKAGIIKPGIPVLTAVDAEEALDVIAAVAASQGAPLTAIGRGAEAYRAVSEVRLRLLGEHQRLNAALAWATSVALEDALPVSGPVRLDALETAEWPGRAQVVQLPGQTLVLDGAHNRHSIQCLCATLQAHFPGRRAVFVMGFLRDKDAVRMCLEVAPIARAIHLAPVHSERTLTPEVLEAHGRELNRKVPTTSHATLSDALAATQDVPLRVVSGSIHFVGEAMTELGLVDEGECQERRLNDWGATVSPSPDDGRGRQ